MCARYTVPGESSVKKYFKFNLPSSSAIRSWGAEVFPTHSCPVLLERDSSIICRDLFWSMLPRGAQNTEFTKKYSTHNAKAETVTTSKLYSRLWQESRRCLIPATGFSEWRGPKGKKTRLLISEPDHEVMFIAGLWSDVNPSGNLDAFTMLTCEPNQFMREIHHRMPVILNLEQSLQWMSSDTAPDQAEKLLRPFSGELVMEVFPPT